MREQRGTVTEWKNWRDIVASERVVDDLGKYKSTTLHTWTRERHGKRDDPGPMCMSSYASVSGVHRRVSLDTTLTPQAIEAIGKNTIHIDDDTMNVEVIVWDDGRALVVATHGRIIGSVWLALIDAMTIPAFPQRFRVCSGDTLEGVFDDESKANGYAAELRGGGAPDVTVEPE
jgi:hypothetical protein